MPLTGILRAGSDCGRRVTRTPGTLAVCAGVVATQDMSGCVGSTVGADTRETSADYDSGWHRGIPVQRRTGDAELGGQDDSRLCRIGVVSVACAQGMCPLVCYVGKSDGKGWGDGALDRRIPRIDGWHTKPVRPGLGVDRCARVRQKPASSGQPGTHTESDRRLVVPLRECSSVRRRRGRIHKWCHCRWERLRSDWQALGCSG
jgi:hypothetical protein